MFAFFFEHLDGSGALPSQTDAVVMAKTSQECSNLREDAPHMNTKSNMGWSGFFETHAERRRTDLSDYRHGSRCVFRPRHTSGRPYHCQSDSEAPMPNVASQSVLCSAPVPWPWAGPNLSAQFTWLRGPASLT